VLWLGEGISHVLAICGQFVLAGPCIRARSLCEEEDVAYVPFYPPHTDFPPDTPTVRRRDITEVDRLGLMVDLTAYQPFAGRDQDGRLQVFLICGK
jgi:hypothetical protein